MSADRRPVWRAAAAAMALQVLVLTLWPGWGGTDAQRERTPVLCVLCGEFGLQDFTANILLFVPLGVALRRAGVSFGAATGLGALLTLAVETAQWLAPIGRDASLGDLLANTLGAALGAVLGSPMLEQLLRPVPRLARTLVAAWLALGLGVLAAGHLAFAPWLPDVPLYGHIAHDFPGRGTFGGRVLDARVAGAPLPDGLLGAVEGAVRRDLASGRLRLDVAVEMGPPRHDAQVVGLATGSGIPFELSQAGDDLLAVFPVRAMAWRLRYPLLRFAGVLAGPPGQRRTLFAAREGDRLLLGAADGAATRVAALRPWHGWLLVTPAMLEFGPGLDRLILALWLGWAVPLVWWGRRSVGRG